MWKNLLWIQITIWTLILLYSFFTVTKEQLDLAISKLYEVDIDEVSQQTSAFIAASMSTTDQTNYGVTSEFILNLEGLTGIYLILLKLRLESMVVLLIFSMLFIIALFKDLSAFHQILKHSLYFSSNLKKHSHLAVAGISIFCLVGCFLLPFHIPMIVYFLLVLILVIYIYWLRLNAIESTLSGDLI